VVNGSRTLGRERVEALVAQALAVWAPHGGLHFSRLETGSADIMVSFAGGDHGDGVVNGSRTLGRERVEALVAQALAVWAPHGGLHFSRLETGSADIMVSSAGGDHGDGVVNGSRTLGRERVEALVAQALAVWAPHGGLHFSRLETGSADIMVSFAGGDHGDGVVNGSRTLGRERVEALVAQALAVWAPHGGQHFSRLETGSADIMVSFAGGDHGDG
ncbi:Stromelysin-3, partial [Operophtera brumata]